MLHGDVRINGTIIGGWTARRLVHPPREVNPYEVEVSYRDPDGRQHTAAGVISHRFGDGALVLASEVLAWAGRMIYPGPKDADSGPADGRQPE